MLRLLYMYILLLGVLLLCVLLIGGFVAAVCC
jgi:hypothetical protein